MTGTPLQNAIIDYMNSLIENGYAEDLFNIIKTRTPVSTEFADSNLVTATYNDKVGLLGILNGVCGLENEFRLGVHMTDDGKMIRKFVLVLTETIR